MYIEVESIEFYKEYVFEAIGTAIRINGKYTISLNQSIQIKDDTIFVLEDNWTWSLKQIESHVTIGRESNNDVVLKHPSISNYHAQIKKGVIQDCMSTNGTYVNNQRIDTVNLQDGDCIWIVDTCILYFERFLIINKPCWNDVIPFFEFDALTYKEEEWKTLPCILPEEIVLESFVVDHKVEKQGLFQSIGSSIMIMVSSCISLLIMYCLHPQQAIQLISMVMMSISMSFSFLVFGLYSRNYNYKKQNEEIERKHTLYKQYLQSIQNRISQRKEQIQTDNHLIQEECVYLNHSFRMYPTFFIGFENKKVFSIQYKNPGYQNVEHPLHRYVEDWIKELDGSEEMPLFYEEKNTYHIQNIEHIVDTLFLRVAYARLDRKVVILSQKKYACITHPLCTKLNHRLWIHDEKSLKEIYDICDESMLYIIEDCTYYESIQSKCKSILWIDEKDGMNVVPFEDAQRYRQTLLFYADHEKEMDFLPYFQQKKNSELDLKLCLGINDDNEQIEIDLSEKGHGPHGLIAGSTGSGKSELMASLLMQLVLKNGPNRVQMLLIDFKGGALGNIFKHFDHFKGMVTNLEKKDIKRFLICMDQIIDTRQLQLAAFQKEYPTLPNHVDTYNLYKDPISHLFIVVDELAQLKSHYPEVLTKLKEIARIGRSLGIHLLLSTQKPVGVVDDQIWANSTFQICLKVANIQDSREILHNDQAAYLDKVGEFIFQSSHKVQTKGTSLYLHQKMENPYIEVDMYDIPLKKDTSKTILEWILENQKPIQNRWLLNPSLSEYEFDQENIVYEDMYSLSQEKFTLLYGQTMSILSYEIQDVSKYLISYYQNECICTYNLNVSDYVDESFMNLNELYRLHSIHQPCTFIAYVEKYEDLEMLSSLFNHPYIRMIVLFDRIETLYLKILNQILIHAHYHWMDREWIYLYYANVSHVRDSIEYDAAICIENQIYEMRFNENKSCQIIHTSRLQLEKDARILLGFSKMHQEIYLDESRSLLICYVQKSMEQKIVRFLQTCKDKVVTTDMDKEFNICVLNLMLDANMLTSKEYLMKQFDIDVLWVGQGFIEYGYPLKRKCFETGVYDMIYFHKQECILLDWS